LSSSSTPSCPATGIWRCKVSILQNRKNKNETLHQLMIFLTLEKGFLKTKTDMGLRGAAAFCSCLQYS
jgi:hypothetical protein